MNITQPVKCDLELARQRPPNFQQRRQSIETAKCLIAGLANHFWDTKPSLEVQVKSPNTLALRAREHSASLAKAAGFRLNPTLPLLDVHCISRSTEAIVSRALVLHACCAISYGFPRDAARKWLAQESLEPYVAPSELLLLDGLGDIAPFRLRPEAVWALCWVVSKTNEFSLTLPMPNHGVSFLPDLRKHHSAKQWRVGLSLRPDSAVAEALDFYYCMHWAMRNDLAGQIADALPEYACAERRRALEWCVAKEEDWDEIRLDT